MYTYLRWTCPKCGQPNEPDAWPRCSWCNYHDPNSPVGRMMEADRSPDPWELDAGCRDRHTDSGGCVGKATQDGWPIPGCVSPAHN